jgi:heme/copper-type cytochrome/quinol oxidase subunit 3
VSAARATPPRAAGAELAARATVSVGMAVALSAIAMTFAALLLAYGIVRAQAPLWPPPGEPPLPALWGYRWAATAVALASSEAMRRAVRALDGLRQRAVVRGLSGAAVLAAAFLGLQLASLGALRQAGVGPSSGIVASVIYALTLFHGLHALVALVVLIPILVTTVRHPHSRATRVRALAAFWHLVTVVWLVVFLVVFVA